MPHLLDPASGRAADPAAERSRTPVRVASVPAGHVYVRHLAAPDDAGGVVRLPDPPPLRATGTSQSQWWPPAILTPEWVHEHADEVDLVHVHFGFDALDPADLERWADALDEHHVPFVLTAHDLRNPHHRTADLHRAQLGVLLRRAAHVITLTDAAAGALRDGWGVEATVLPHPHVVDAAWLERPRPDHEGLVVGVHCKSLRANLDPLPVIETLVGLTDEIPGLRVRVDVHLDVMTPGMDNHDEGVAARLRGWAGSGLLELHEHDYLSDDELYAYLASLDVSVLPYRFGSHSGWLEACHDLGTTLVAPTCGFYADQRPCLSFRMDEETYDPATLVTAIEAAARGPRPARPGREARYAERRRLARRHEEIYREALRGLR